MAQTITDYNTFLKDAREAVAELAEFSRKEEELRQREGCLEKSLEAEKKAVSDAIDLTVRKRRDEISASYDREIGKIQERLKKVRNKREKAKNQGVKERIKEETAELVSYNRELRVRMRTLFQKEHIPGFCNSGYYYALYFPRGIKEILLFLITFAFCFFLVPYTIHELLPEKKTFYLMGIYLVCILVFGGLYTVVGNVTRGRHMAALREGRMIRNLIASNNNKIRVITKSIRRDKDEALYNLGRFDDEIAQLDQDLAETAKKKKEALNTFESVTKTIIMDEIAGNSRDKLESLRTDLEGVSDRLNCTETLVKEKRIYITDTYESYLGKEFLNVDRIEELRRILEAGEAGNISEAIEVYRNRGNKALRA